MSPKVRRVLERLADRFSQPLPGFDLAGSDWEDSTLAIDWLERHGYIDAPRLEENPYPIQVTGLTALGWRTVGRRH